MAESRPSDDGQSESAQRRAVREMVSAYHQQELLGLLEHVREGFARLDAGELDVFELDELIHRYKRAAKMVWSFCGSSGSQWERAANALRGLRERGESPPDWWQEAAPRERG
jgi:hypothetical protein